MTTRARAHVYVPAEVQGLRDQAPVIKKFVKIEKNTTYTHIHV